MRRADVPPLAARDVDQLARLLDEIVEDLREVKNLEEIGPVLRLALERTENVRGGKFFEFSQGKSVGGVAQCTHNQRSRTDCRNQ